MVDGDNDRVAVMELAMLNYSHVATLHKTSVANYTPMPHLTILVIFTKN